MLESDYEIDPKITKRIRSIVFCALRECIKKNYRVSLISCSISVYNNKFVCDIGFYNPLELRLRGKKASDHYYSDLGKLYGISSSEAVEMAAGFIYGHNYNPFQRFGCELRYECQLLLRK